MSQDTPAAESTANSTQPPTVNIPQLVDLTGGILGKLLISASKDKAKHLFKDLKSGSVVDLGEITAGEKLKFKLKLAMDYSEFVGPGFNFDVFQASLKQLLGGIAPRLKSKQDLNFRTSEQGGILVGVPGVIQTGEQINVLMLCLEMGTAGQVGIQLMYMDPTQFVAQQ